MAYAFKRNWGLKALAGLILAHGTMDSFAGHYQITGSQLTLILTMISAAVLALALVHRVGGWTEKGSLKKDL